MEFTFNNDATPMMLIVFVFLFLVGLIMWKLYRVSRTLAPEEESLAPLYRVTCSSVIGLIRATVPFCELRVYPGLVAIGHTRGTMVFRPHDLESITFGRPTFLDYKGLRFIHTNSNYNKHILLQVPNSVEAIQALESAGFVVTR